MGLLPPMLRRALALTFELYAGGAGAALDLLMGGDVRRIVLNDADTHIFHFWDSILRHTDDFLRLLADTPVNMDEWHRQRAIYEGNEDGNNFHSAS